MQKYEVEQTGEVLEDVEQTEKTSKAKASWGVRLDQDTIAQLDKVGEILGVNGDKRAVLEHLLKVRTTAELKGQTKGKTDTIENIEKALDLIRNEMNTLLRHNINKEEEIRDVVSIEIQELEGKIKDLQNKLNNQLDINKALQQENKDLKAEITTKTKELKETQERYATTDKLIAKLEEDLESNKKKIDEFEELKLAHKELQTTSSAIKNELLQAQAEATKTNTELSIAKQSIVDKNKEIKSITEAKEKEIETLKTLNTLELNNSLLQKELEFKNAIQQLKESKQSKEKTKNTAKKKTGKTEEPTEEQK